MPLKKRTTEETPIAVHEEGLESCAHCGGKLEEIEEGIFKCESCGKKSVSRVVLYKEKQKEKALDEGEAKDFTQIVSATTLEEFTDFCWRLYRAQPGKGSASHTILSVEKDRSEILSRVGEEHSDLLLCAQNQPVSKQELADFLKAVKQRGCGHAFVFSTAGFEKDAFEWARDFEEIDLFGMREMAALAKKRGVRVQEMNPVITNLKRDELGVALLKTGDFFGGVSIAKNKIWLVVLIAAFLYLPCAMLSIDEGGMDWGGGCSWIIYLAIIAIGVLVWSATQSKGE